MYFTSGSDRAFEQLMQGKPGFDHYDSGEAVTPEDCGTCRFYRPHWKYQFCVYAECPYQPGKLTAYDAVTFRVKGVENSAIQFPLFRPAPCASGALLSAQLSHPRRKFQSRGNLQLSPYNITHLHCIVHSISMECCYM